MAAAGGGCAKEAIGRVRVRRGVYFEAVRRSFSCLSGSRARACPVVPPRRGRRQFRKVGASRPQGELMADIGSTLVWRIDPIDEAALGKRLRRVRGSLRSPVTCEFDRQGIDLCEAAHGTKYGCRQIADEHGRVYDSTAAQRSRCATKRPTSPPSSGERNRATGASSWRQAAR